MGAKFKYLPMLKIYETKIVVRKHEKDNLVTNFWKIFASVLVLSFLWNIGKRF